MRTRYFLLVNLWKKCQSKLSRGKYEDYSLYRKRSSGVVEDRYDPRPGSARVAIKASSPGRPELTRRIKRPSRRFLDALLYFPLPNDPLLLHHACCIRKFFVSLSLRLSPFKLRFILISIKL